MIELTPQQEALATLKANLHLPGGGFHALIVELAREYQLPFQAVRKVLKQSQKSIERKIKQDFDKLDDHELTQEHWLNLIRTSLKLLAQDIQPVMVTMTQSSHYQQAITAIATSINTEQQQAEILEMLAMTYELEVYKPLTAMLYTSILYWKLPDDLYQMTEEKQQIFSGYPQHMQATVHLLELADRVKNESCTAS